ncbi:MAG: hypothetical protein ACHQWU_02760 [Gemmatimonadales bacterium]
MTDPAVFYPTLLGVSFLVAGIISYRRQLEAPTLRNAFGLVALGPVFVAASLATFAGEHFTAAAALAQLVPKWLPGRLFIAYFVGVAHLAAALSIVAKRYIRWSAFGLALMFALFVLLMDLPAAIAHPTVRIAWSLAARETTFSIGALALFRIAMEMQRPRRAASLAPTARYWTACVLIFYGIENLLYPQFAPGVPDVIPTAAWVPAASVIAYATGILLIAFGATMFVAKRASAAAAWCGLLMVVLTIGLYVPQFFIARDVAQQVNGFNFVFDTLLFAGMMLVVSRAIAVIPFEEPEADPYGPRVERAGVPRPPPRAEAEVPPHRA